MKPYKWRITISGAVYVDSMTGSDLMGNGTQSDPFRTLRKAWDYSGTKPTSIVCRGFFSEDMADGNHACTIRGDYMGAATFDGNDVYTIYGFTHIDFVAVNCAVGSLDMVVWSASGLFAGVGRASTANAVGNAISVYGVAGSPVIIDRSGLYWGIIGGTSAVQYNVFSKIKNNSTHPVSLGFSGNITLRNNVMYGCRIANRRKRITTYVGTFYLSIFADFDLFADETGVTFDTCLFTSDCKWYYGATEIVITGSTSAAREASLIAGMDALEIPTASRPVFVNCKFSTQLATDVFNNPEKVDFTLKHNGDGVRGIGLYYGALPPAINIPIMDDSSQTAETWDENSVSGCVAVSGNSICIDELSADFNGEILSKILIINPQEININAIFAQFAAKFQTYRAYLYDVALTGLTYTDADELPIGRYIVKGSIVYDGVNIGDNAICVVTTTGTYFTDVNDNSVLIALEDANISNVCYVRQSPLIYTRIKAADGLQAGATYLNSGLENITYRGRTIVPHESFVAANSVDTFSASSADYEIGVMFDDTRVPSSEWIPAQLFGEYFNWLQSGVQQYDTDGVPISSGNYLSFQTSTNGGYSNLLTKSILNRVYLQFRVKVKRYRVD